MRSTEPPPLEQPRGPSRRFAGLDGLRAMAVVAVVLFHADASLLPGGFLGVDLFFAISGYLISRLLLAELRATGGLDLTAFYLRRAFRLLPAVLVMLVVITVGCLTVWRDELATLRGGLISTLTYSGNWWLIGAHQSYFVASGRPPMTQQLWSLAIEEQFYLIWPLFLVIATAGLYRVRRRIGRLSGPAYPSRWPLPHRFGLVALLCLVLAVVSTATMAWQAIRQDVPFGADSSRIYFGTDTHAMGLLFGAMFGALAERQLLTPKRWRVRRWVTDLVAAVALIAVVVCAVRLDQFSVGLYRGGFGVVSLVAAAGVAAVARCGSRLGSRLDAPPLRWLAKRSYAIYLWHWPVVVVTRPDVDLSLDHRFVLAIRLLVPIVLAEASYRLVERPARRWGAGYLARRAGGADLRVRTVFRLPAWRWLAVAGLVGAFAVLVALPDGRTATSLQPLAATGPAAATAAVPSSVAAASGAVSSGAATSGTAASGTAPAGRSSSGQAPSKRPATKTIASTPQRKPAVEPTPVISAYGDSVMLGAQNALAAAFAGCDLRAVEGRQPYVTLAEIRSDHDAGRLHDTVVIHTGNNGLIRPSDLAGTLSDLADRRRVVLLTDRVPTDWQNPNNATITRIGQQFRNVVVLDWYARSNGDRAWFYADGLHLRPDGAGHYAGLVLAAAR